MKPRRPRRLRRRLGCIALLLLSLPPLLWLSGRGTRPDAPLLSFLSSGRPIRLHVDDPGKLRTILASPTVTDAYAIFLRCASLLSADDTRVHADVSASEVARPSLSRSTPLETGSDAPSSGSPHSTHPAPLHHVQQSRALRFLYGRLTGFAVVHDPTDAPATGTGAVFTVDNLGQALLRVALPIIGEASGDAYRVALGGTSIDIRHEGGSLFRIGARPLPSDPAVGDTPLPHTSMHADDVDPLFGLRVTGSVLAGRGDIGDGIDAVDVSLFGEKDGARLVVTVEGRVPPRLLGGMRALLGNVSPEPAPYSGVDGLHLEVAAPFDAIRRAVWAWYLGEGTEPRAGVALPWESDLDAVLRDLAASSDGGGVSLFLKAPPEIAEASGVPPVPQVVLAWRAHPDADRVGVHLDRAMERLARSVREFSPQALERRVLGGTEWVPDASGATRGTVAMHPLFFHHLAPTVAVQDGVVLLSAYPVPDGSDLAVRVSAQAEGRGAGAGSSAQMLPESAGSDAVAGTCVRLVWEADPALQACLVDLALDCMVGKAWVAESDHARVEGLVEGADALLRVWRGFMIRVERVDGAEAGRVRVEWEMPLR